MSRRTVIWGLAIISGLASWSGARSLQAGDDPLWGTWKLNIEKSTFSSGPPPKSNTHKYEPYGTDGVRATAHVVDAEGREINFQYSLKYDGKFYPVVGDPSRDMTSLKRIDAYTGVGANMKGGKVINSSRHVLSNHGRTLTVTLTRAGISDVRVYEKQQ
jgi:hypothetical protein